MPSILIVDDDRAFCGQLFAALERMGCTVRVAADAEAGLCTALAAPPDLAVVCAELSGLDGYELCRRLKAEAATQATALVLLYRAESTERAHRHQALPKPADDYVLRPSCAADLLRRLGCLLGLAPLAAAAPQAPVPAREERGAGPDPAAPDSAGSTLEQYLVSSAATTVDARVPAEVIDLDATCPVGSDLRAAEQAAAELGQRDREAVADASSSSSAPIPLTVLDQGSGGLRARLEAKEREARDLGEALARAEESLRAEQGRADRLEVRTETLEGRCGVLGAELATVRAELDQAREALRRKDEALVSLRQEVLRRRAVVDED
ncbi:MAG: response regulator [Deltaproteobacteria bacterium]|nr:response regulator [Deltaproteobacteria bacterium]